MQEVESPPASLCSRTLRGSHDWLVFRLGWICMECRAVEPKFPAPVSDAPMPSAVSTSTAPPGALRAGASLRP